MSGRSVHWRFDDDANTAVQRAIGDHLKIKLPTPSEIHKKKVQKMVEWFKYPGMRFTLKKKKKGKRDLNEVDDLGASDFDALYEPEILRCSRPEMTSSSFLTLSPARS
ncbi:unnamed protein product [Clonostachys chloroleuca]|uniref:Uncharacterized protein n=1 Tax=Clonostachys chloroleuca TaxID=1926264 RepID=A0AA35LRQ5_9HYPO|nr:unnamed protein product [Clonostachys chloroleuca]